MRAESARAAELHARKRKYGYATPVSTCYISIASKFIAVERSVSSQVTFIDEEEVPIGVAALEELVHFVEPPLMDNMFTSEEMLRTQYSTVENEGDRKHSSSSSSTDDEN